MENLVDITKLKTVANKSYDLRVSIPTVWNWIKKGKLKSLEIDGVTFCVEEEYWKRTLFTMRIALKLWRESTIIALTL